MEADLYQSTFAGLLLLNSVALYRSYRTNKNATPESPTTSEKVEHRGREDDDAQLVRRLKWTFLPVYLLVNGADWLQGPYIYPIYKDEKGLPESLVALLFMVGFLSGGISASFAGTCADRFGRKAACLSYCIIYSLSCLTLLSNWIPLLFLGRVLGGISGTLLYSVFESWLVAEFNKLRLDAQSSALSAIFSTMTTLNSLVAIVAGVTAGWLVDHIGTAKAPFMMSMGCLSLAFIVISKTWSENYGTRHDGDTPEASALLTAAAEEGSEQGDFALPKKSTLQTIWQDSNILTLALTSCFFEGSLFLFIFFKFPALKLCHELAGSTKALPFGLIFAILMCSMMLGSQLHSALTSLSFAPKAILGATLLTASACFFLPTWIRAENLTLWCFCVFELCCGLYFPAMASLKGSLIEDGVRASLYGMLRVPLNAFVVVALSTTSEGEAHRSLVFAICGGLMIAAAAIVKSILR